VEIKRGLAGVYPKLSFLNDYLMLFAQMNDGFTNSHNPSIVFVFGRVNVANPTETATRTLSFKPGVAPFDLLHGDV
jgi:hypothetical protein